MWIAFVIGSVLGAALGFCVMGVLHVARVNDVEDANAYLREELERLHSENIRLRHPEETEKLKARFFDVD